MFSITRPLARCHLSTLLRRAELVGEVDNHVLVEPADFYDRRFGASRAVPTVLEIPVSTTRPSPGDVGKIVKDKFFAHVPEFMFNVAFSCGDPGLFGPGVYSDPLSIWFNIFFGYYQIDVPKTLWNRPFGYRSAQPGDVEVDDILRIGKSDWNYFSNYMYGVPLAEIQPHDQIQQRPAKIRRGVMIGNSAWDEVEIDDVDVVSAYVAPGEEDRLCNPNPLLSRVWRAIFGRPHPREQFRQSFMGMKMRAKLYMSFHDVEHDVDLDRRTWATLMFGGTVRSDYPDQVANEHFLCLQMNAVRHVMEHRYGHLGFPPGGGIAVRRVS